MNEIYKKLRQMNTNEILLVECNMFFKKLGDICFFVIDDKDELHELKKILKNIKSIDNDAFFFCCTYGVDRNDDKLYIYCDNLFICTSLGLEEVQSIFSKYDTFNNPFRGIVPSEVTILSLDDIISKKIKYVIYDTEEIKDFQDELKTMKNGKIKSLFWD